MTIEPRERMRGRVEIVPDQLRFPRSAASLTRRSPSRDRIDANACTFLPIMGARYAGLFALVLGCSGPVKRPDGGVGLLQSGSRAPELQGRDAGGHDVKLSDVRGKLAVVYF